MIDFQCILVKLEFLMIKAACTVFMQLKILKPTFSGEPLFTIPLLRPDLPTADLLLPYLRQIDDSKRYSNFGPLQNELLNQLISFQRQTFGRVVHGVCAGSATLALELSLAALNLPRGCKIGLPAFTFPATATAIIRCGHVPIVLDVDPQSWITTPFQMGCFDNPKDLGAVIPVSAFGMPQDPFKWSSWSLATGVPVIIDAAAAYGGQNTAPGVTVVFSMHATKTLSSGEGGFILTEDQSLAAKLMNMTNFGIREESPCVGTNSKMSEYHAAVGLAHFSIWSEQVIRRRKMMAFYQQHLLEACGSQISLQNDTGCFAPSIFAVLFETQDIRDKVEQACMRNRIETRQWYLPLIQEQPFLGTVEVPYPTPHATRLQNTLLGLPFHLGLQFRDISHIVNVIAAATDIVKSGRT